MAEMAVKSVTTDAFYGGGLKVTQPREGYRFSVDAVILAHHVRPKPNHTVLDLGTGSGIIPLMLAYRYPRLHVSGIEVQADLAALATENARVNRLDDRISIACGDMKTILSEGTGIAADWVVSNPPYRKAASGRLNPSPQKAVARHEISITLPELLRCARNVLPKGGRFTTIYPAARAVELLSRMHQTGMEPKMIRWIHSRSAGEAKLILVEGRRDARPGVRVAAPLIVYQKDGRYTQEAGLMFAPPGSKLP
jgi:tRNA1Val (adenine37-N6)-methyltransferase